MLCTDKKKSDRCCCCALLAPRPFLLLHHPISAPFSFSSRPSPFFRILFALMLQLSSPTSLLMYHPLKLLQPPRSCFVPERFCNKQRLHCAVSSLPVPMRCDNCTSAPRIRRRHGRAGWQYECTRVRSIETVRSDAWCRRRMERRDKERKKNRTERASREVLTPQPAEFVSTLYSFSFRLHCPMSCRTWHRKQVGSCASSNW